MNDYPDKYNPILIDTCVVKRVEANLLQSIKDNGTVAQTSTKSKHNGTISKEYKQIQFNKSNNDVSKESNESIKPVKSVKSVKLVQSIEQPIEPVKPIHDVGIVDHLPEHLSDNHLAKFPIKTNNVVEISRPPIYPLPLTNHTNHTNDTNNQQPSFSTKVKDCCSRGWKKVWEEFIKPRWLLSIIILCILLFIIYRIIIVTYSKITGRSNVDDDDSRSGDANVKVKSDEQKFDYPNKLDPSSSDINNTFAYN